MRVVILAVLLAAFAVVGVVGVGLLTSAGWACLAAFAAGSAWSWLTFGDVE